MALRLQHTPEACLPILRMRTRTPGSYSMYRGRCSHQVEVYLPLQSATYVTRNKHELHMPILHDYKYSRYPKRCNTSSLGPTITPPGPTSPPLDSWFPLWATRLCNPDSHCTLKRWHHIKKQRPGFVTVKRAPRLFLTVNLGATTRHAQDQFVVAVVNGVFAIPTRLLAVSKTA